MLDLVDSCRLVFESKMVCGPLEDQRRAGCIVGWFALNGSCESTLPPFGKEFVVLIDLHSVDLDHYHRCLSAASRASLHPSLVSGSRLCFSGRPSWSAYPGGLWFAHRTSILAVALLSISHKLLNLKWDSMTGLQVNGSLRSR